MPQSSLDNEKLSWIKSLEIPSLDKAVHLLLFFFLTIFFCLAFRKKTITLFFVPFLIGIIIEILQELISLGRSFEFLDILANTIGVILGIIAIRIFKKNYSNLR